MVEDFAQLIYNCQNSQLINLLTIGNFPDITQKGFSRKINKMEMNNMSPRCKGYYDYKYYERDLYLNITSNSYFHSSDDGGINHRFIFIRIIRCDSGFEIDFNSDKESYPYEDYDV